MAEDTPRDSAQTACVRRRALQRRPPVSTADELGRPLWLVTVTLGGPPLGDDQVRYGLELLNDVRAFMVSTRYDDQHAEVRYWDEGDTAADTTRQALSLWGGADVAEVLPGWQLTGLNVVDRAMARRQWTLGQHPAVFALGEILPFDDHAQLA